MFFILSLSVLCFYGAEVYAGAAGGKGGAGGTGGAGGKGGAGGTGGGKGPAGAAGPPPTIPIDGGILLLLGAGAAYGAKRIYDANKKTPLT